MIKNIIYFFLMLAAWNISWSETTNSPTTIDNADTAWNELQQNSKFPKKPIEWAVHPPTDEQKHRFYKQIADAAIMAADEAKTFYQHFPDSTNVIPAKILECKMLERAFNNSGATQDSVTAWGNAQDALLSDPRLIGDDRCDLRLAILWRRTFDRRPNQKISDIDYEKGLRELIKDYPKRDGPYAKLLDFSTRFTDEKAASIANEVLVAPVSETNKIKAEGILRRVNATGKPLDIKFTALDGRQVDLSRMKGKVVLVDFWATWCGPCVGEIPSIKAVYQKFHAQGFEIVGISFDGQINSLVRFVQKNGMPWPEYFDGQNWDNKFGIQYGIHEIPQVWLVDKKGNLRETGFRNDELQDKVEKLLAE